jgi:hypothetical protein
MGVLKMAMSFETFVKTWSRNDFRRLLNGTKVDRVVLDSKIKSFGKMKNSQLVESDVAEKLVLCVATERGFIR